MQFRWISIGLLSFLISVQAFAGINMTVNVKDGDTISGEAIFKIAVESESLVTSVEFYVGEDLRDTDESSPYEFRLDTLKEQAGSIDVTFAAYNKAGESTKKKLKLKIDNAFDKGIDYHISLGQEAASNGNFEVALSEARIALKIDQNNNNARLLMARANLGLGVIDIAEKYAEDAVVADPNNQKALDLYSAVNLKKAFSIIAKFGDKTEAHEQMGKAFAKSAEARHKSLELSVDAFGAVTDANRMAFCDLLFSAGRYGRIISELDPLFKKDFKNNAVANRLLYAQIRAGRFTSAVQTLENMRKYGEMDGASFALKAVVRGYLGDNRGALDAEKEAILNDPTSLEVKTAQAYLALRRNDTKTATNIMVSLANSQGQAAVVNYGISSLAFLVADFEQTRDKFQTALLAEPAAYDMYVERGNQSMWFSMRDDMKDDAEYGKRQRQLAKIYFEAALAAKPDSFEALTGLTCVALLDGRKADAINLGRAASAAGSEYAAAQWAYAAALLMSTDDKLRELGKTIVKKSEVLDPIGLEGKPFPTAKTAWNYFYSRGRIPWLLNPSN